MFFQNISIFWCKNVSCTRYKMLRPSKTKIFIWKFIPIASSLIYHFQKVKKSFFQVSLWESRSSWGSSVIGSSLVPFLSDGVLFSILCDRVFFMVFSDRVFFMVLSGRVLFRIHSNRVLLGSSVMRSSLMYSVIGSSLGFSVIGSA